MQCPLKTTSRDFTLREAVEDEIRDKAASRESFCEPLSGCEVTVRAAAIKHHRKGAPFRVDIRLTVPGRRLIVGHQDEAELQQANRAFNAARRQMEDYAREERRLVKTHERTAPGHVTRLERKAGFGFLETPDGREIILTATAYSTGPSTSWTWAR
jgi:hypothetical protein